ncbi:MAG TPA: hypothetical protein VFB01_01655 [Burkholderiales bacterium]|nr:hypothetical protein [Burkholderiales bacterium]
MPRPLPPARFAVPAAWRATCLVLAALVVPDVLDFALDLGAGVAAGALMLLYVRRKSETEAVCAES